MDEQKYCANCIFTKDYDKSVLYIRCEKIRKYVTVYAVCKDYAAKEGNK